MQRAGVEVGFWCGRWGFVRGHIAEVTNRFIGKLKCRRRIPLVDYGVRKADLVVFSGGGNDFPEDAVRICRERRIRYVLVIHSVSESTWPRDGEAEVWRKIYQGTEAAYFVSQANRESTICQLGFGDPKFKVVVNPFNVPWETPFSWPSPEERTEWAFVGRLEPGHKGVDLLLRAFARERWKDRAVHINLYGGGFSEQSLKRMTTMLELDGRVTFHGQVSDLEQIWSRNQLLVLPSRHEGLPLVVTEAMMYGRPCLVTNVSGNGEQLVDGVTGFLATGPTVDAVDAAMERAWLERGRYREMGEAAYQSIRSRIPRDPIQVFNRMLLSEAGGIASIEDRVVSGEALLTKL